MNEILFGDLKDAFLFMFFLGLLGLVAMPFIGNEKEPAENSKILNQFAAFTLLSAISIIIQIIFEKDPNSANLFIKSVFLPISPEEESKIANLQIPLGLLFLNTICIGGFTFFCAKIIENALQDYAIFLSRPTSDRLSWFMALKQIHLTKNGFIHAFFYVISFFVLTVVLRTCGITLEH